MQNDTNTYGYNQWFYFSIRNMKPHTKYTFRIANFVPFAPFRKNPTPSSATDCSPCSSPSSKPASKAAAGTATAWKSPTIPPTFPSPAARNTTPSSSSSSSSTPTTSSPFPPTPPTATPN